jgi:hypothetical protein
MTVTLTEKIYIAGVLRDVGYEWTGPEAEEAALVFNQLATKAPPDESMVSAEDTVVFQDVSMAHPHTVTIDAFCTAAGIPQIPRWDDLRFPAQSINPPGTLDGPTVDATETGWPGTLLFVGNGDRVLCGVAQMPHAWARGTAIKPHIHWTKPTGSADAVTWEFLHRIIGNPGDTPGAWSSASTGTIVAGDQTHTDEHLLTTFADIDMTGNIESAMVAWRLYRRGSTDADASTVRLLELDFHYQINQLGTVSVIPTE